MNKMNPAVKWGIISGLASTLLFVYFLDPILSYLGKLLLNTARLLSTSYLDRFYSEVATGDIDYSFMLAIILLVIPFVIYSFNRLANFIETKLTKTKDKQKGSKTDIWGSVLLILSFTCMLIFIVDGFARKRISTSFRQHLAILTPYISEDEKNILISKYSSMSSENDYRLLVKQMKSVAIAHNINLPPNKLYMEK